MGSFWARNAFEPGGLGFLEIRNRDSRCEPPPIFDGTRVIVAGGDGRVHAIGAASADAPALVGVPANDGAGAAVHTVTSAGERHCVCRRRRRRHAPHRAQKLANRYARSTHESAITTPPSIVDGVVYFANAGTNVFQLPEGTCPSYTGSGAIPMGFATDKDVTVIGDRLLMPSGVALNAVHDSCGGRGWLL